MRALRLSLAAVACLASVAIATPAVSPVADAARHGDRETVRTLLREGADVNAAQGDGMTALHWAAMHDDVEMAEMLLYAGASLRAATRVGAYTPLLVAGKYGNSAVIATLLRAGADANSTTANGTTPLMLAAASGDSGAVRVLLEAGAEVNTRESTYGQTALIFAAGANYVEPITALVEAGADPNLASFDVDVVEQEQRWRETFAAKRREAIIRARSVEAAQAEQERAAEPEERQTASEAAAAELKSEEGEATEPDADEEAVAGAAEGNEAKAQAETAEAVEDQELAGTPGTPGQAAEATGTEQEGATESEEAEEAEPGAERAPEAEEAEQPERLSYGGLIGKRGGMSPLHHATRQGHVESAQALLELGADIDHLSADGTSPLLMATINGHFDLAMFLLQQGADPTLASDSRATPLYAALNVQWAPKSLYPQPRAFGQQQTTHVELMRALLDAGAATAVRLDKKIWYSGYNFDLSGVNEGGATPFWRAAYAGDLAAMRLLVAYGADPSIPTRKPPGRPRTGDATREIEDHSGLPPVPVGGPAVTPLQAAAGVGFGEGFAANSHRHAPGSWLPAVRFLIEELGAEVNALDHEGNTALHHAAARGDNEMILYLVERGADVTVVNREGHTVADMANGPVQRIRPFPKTVALLESLGSKNNHRCVSC